MTLDIRGSLKNTKISKNPLVVFDELFTNAIDSFLIHRHVRKDDIPLEISFNVTIMATDLLGEEYDLAVTCCDNGAGFGEEQTEAFLTKDTSYKDDLAIEGIGKCKGAGRIQFFHHFENIEIDSGFVSDGKRYRRRLDYHEGQKKIEPSDFPAIEEQSARLGTKFTLRRLKNATRERVFVSRDLPKIINAKSLKNHLLVNFMARLVGLKSRLGQFDVSIEVTIVDQNKKSSTESEKICIEDLPEITATKKVKVYEVDPSTGERTGIYECLDLSHYKLPIKQYELPSNTIALCAKSSPVKSIAERYLRPKSVENNPIGDHYHVVLVQGGFLDRTVNEQRDDFDIPVELSQDYFYSQQRISLEQIFEAIDDAINEFVAPPDWSKDGITRAARETFGISEEMLTETGTRVRYGDTPQSVAGRVLGKYQERALKETARLHDLKEEIKELEPDSDEFRVKINELAWQHTATLRTIDMANLSQLVVRRAAIVDVLALACSKKLKMQADDALPRRKDERIIHSVFFPMRRDSSQSVDHDIWLLSEEYQYFKYIASDMPLANIKWDDGQDLFEPDIDDELAQILKKNEDENSSKRPDIAIFSKEGSAIIIEFKAPGVNLDEHVADLMEYSQLLAAKSKGRLKQFYGYLIGDSLNQNRMRGYKRFPNGRGWFGTEEILEHTTGTRLGELYSEILFYDDIVERASARLAVYKKRLNIE